MLHRGRLVDHHRAVLLLVALLRRGQGRRREHRGGKCRENDLLHDVTPLLDPVFPGVETHMGGCCLKRFPQSAEIGRKVSPVRELRSDAKVEPPGGCIVPIETGALTALGRRA
ncbi:MAG: hypothetical protein WDN44_02295 [Sphingomonas sp.]